MTEKDYEHKIDTVDGEEIYFKKFAGEEHLQKQKSQRFAHIKN